MNDNFKFFFNFLVTALLAVTITFLITDLFAR